MARFYFNGFKAACDSAFVAVNKLRGVPYVILALAALALSASSVLASSPQKIIALGPDLITVLTKAPVQDRKTGVHEDVELQGEVVSETAAAANGWRSMRSTLDVSCPERRVRVRSMIVFKDHNGMGEATSLTPPADWITPEQNTSYGLAVVKYFCGDGGSRLATRVPTPKLPPAKTPMVEVPLARTPLTTSQLANVRVAASAPASPPPEPSATTTNGVSTIDAAASSSDQKDVRTAKAGARLPRSSALGPFAVQVGSTTVQADANAIFNRLKVAHADLFGGLQTRIEVADVSGQRHYRALVIGFLDPTGAASFCTMLHASNGCIVRRTPPGAS